MSVLFRSALLLATAATIATAPPVRALRAPLPGAIDVGAVGPVEVHGETDFPVWDNVTVRGGRFAPVMISDGILFRYRDEEADRVSLVGEFNDWNDGADPLQRRRDGLWSTTIDLPPGEWSYLFAVDGEWIRDPDNPIVGRDESSDRVDASLIRVGDDDVTWPRPYRFQEGSFDFNASYDRVNQVMLDLTLRYENRVELHPELAIGGGWSFGQERWVYLVGVDQPLFAERLMDIGVSAYRISATPDEHRIGDFENTLFTLLFREDWRDHYEAEGVAAHTKWYLGKSVELGVRWKSEQHRSLDKTTNWGLFGGGKEMRDNPPVDEGELQSVAVAYGLDTRNSLRNPTRGFLMLAEYEWAGGGIGGDFEFRRGIADVRRYLKLSRAHFVDLRIAGGLIEDARRAGPEGQLSGFDAVPVQERFYLGGTGTMRATQFKSLTGDRMLLGNAELRVEVFRDFQAVVFTDVGDAWIEEDAKFDLKVDAGVGFQDSDGSIRVNIAKKMDRGNQGDVFVSARIQRMF